MEKTEAHKQNTERALKQIAESKKSPLTFEEIQSGYFTQLDPSVSLQIDPL
jgi:hypothetical protein